MAPRTRCKGFVEEGGSDINVFEIISNIALKVRIRKVGESRSAVWMADRTPVQNQLKQLHSSDQVRDLLRVMYLANFAWPASVSRAISLSTR